MIKTQSRYIEKNVEIAKTLLSIVQQHLIDHSKINKLGPQDIDTVFEKVKASFDYIEQLFEKAHAECFEEIKTKFEDNRTDFLTRIVYAKLSDIKQLKLKHPHKKNIIVTESTKVLIRGIQKNLKTMLSTQEWSNLNAQSKDVLDLLSDQNDKTIISNLKNNKIAKILAERVFLSFLLKFKNLTLKKQEFMRIMNVGLYESYYSTHDQCEIIKDDYFTDEHFCIVFMTLFEDYLPLVSTEEGLSYLRSAYGEETTSNIKKILVTFSRYKESIFTMV